MLLCFSNVSKYLLGGILCLLQSGKSDGIVNALTGQSSNLFAHQKERGAELILTRVTAGLAIVFFVIAIILRMS